MEKSLRMSSSNIDTAKAAGDVLALGTVFGTLIKILPAIAAVFTIVWTGIRIYETKTVQDILKKRRKERRK